MDIEIIAMELVGNAGEARSLAFEALAEAKKGNFEKAEELLELSKEALLKAHHIQTELICNEADGKKNRNRITNGSCTRPFDEFYTCKRINF